MPCALCWRIFHRTKRYAPCRPAQNAWAVSPRFSDARAKMPVAIAPVGLTGMQHADGEILAARAAEKFGIPFTLST